MREFVNKPRNILDEDFEKAHIEIEEHTCIICKKEWMCVVINNLVKYGEVRSLISKGIYISPLCSECPGKRINEFIDSKLEESKMKKYQFVNRSPEWMGIGYRKLKADEGLSVIYEKFYWFGFWEIRKWQMNKEKALKKYYSARKKNNSASQNAF